jgi:hypothetical protein
MFTAATDVVGLGCMLYEAPARPRRGRRGDRPEVAEISRSCAIVAQW